MNEEERKKDIDLKRKKHIERTGMVVYGVNYIQLKAGHIISKLYFGTKKDNVFVGGEVNKTFIRDVTSGKYSSYMMVVDMLSKAVVEKLQGEEDRAGRIYTNMKRLGEIRNKFAHEPLLHGINWKSYFMARDREFTPYEFQSGDPEETDIEVLFANFKKIEKTVLEDLEGVDNKIELGKL